MNLSAGQILGETNFKRPLGIAPTPQTTHENPCVPSRHGPRAGAFGFGRDGTMIARLAYKQITS